MPKGKARNGLARCC